MILIHFGDALSANKTAPACDQHPRFVPAECASLAQLYRESSGYHANSVYLLLPACWGESEGSPVSTLGDVSVIRHTDYGLPRLPDFDERSDTWLINGTQWPIIDWKASRLVAGRRDCEVLVFGPPGPHSGDRYAESLRVDESGQVVSFIRHHTDSSAYVDSWAGPASFLVCSGRNLRAVAGQIIAHGWGLDNIGALTRRFHVGWADAHGAPSDTSASAKARTSLRSRHRVIAPRHPPLLARRPGGGNGQTLKIDAQVSRDGPAGAIAGAGRRNGSRKSILDTDIPASAAAVAIYRTFEDTGTPYGSETASDALSTSVTGWPAGFTGEKLAYRFAKRAIDIALSGAALVMLCPFLLLTAALVKLNSRGPVLFGDKRQGRRGTEFACLKFRTMIDGAAGMQSELRADNEVDGPQFKISRDPRLTGLGVWLRRYNIDELPQLINVLRGDMSLVGPRPSPDAENQFCPGWRRARLSVRPGITGLWQVMRLRPEFGSDFDEWIYYDLEYVRHRSLWLDWQILSHTPLTMFAPDGLDALAQRLKRHGVCVHSPRVARNGSSSASDQRPKATGGNGRSPTPRKTEPTAR